jgi:hypothetical protein
VTNAAAAIIGRQTVQYVGNIYKYCICLLRGDAASRRTKQGAQDNGAGEIDMYFNPSMRRLRVRSAAFVKQDFGDGGTLPAFTVTFLPLSLFIRAAPEEQLIFIARVEAQGSKRRCETPSTESE